MKRIIKNNLLGFIVGVGTVFALTYVESKNVKYTTDKDSSIQNVEDAVNKLYDNLKSNSNYVYWFPVRGSVEMCGGATYNQVNNCGITCNYISLPKTLYSSQADLKKANGTVPYARSSIVDNVLTSEICVGDGTKEVCVKPAYAAGGRYADDVAPSIESKLKEVFPDSSCQINDRKYQISCNIPTGVRQSGCTFNSDGTYSCTFGQSTYNYTCSAKNDSIINCYK